MAGQWPHGRWGPKQVALLVVRPLLSACPTTPSTIIGLAGTVSALCGGSSSRWGLASAKAAATCTTET